ncbi:MAG: M20/M25/M40 family metallo-hydrolase, partial [Streptosporangiaceae bacterium]
VYPAGTLAQMPFRLDKERAHGPGIYDMKAGVVQALFALLALHACGEAPRRPLRWLWVFDEELGSRGSRPHTERLARGAAAALVLEPAAEPGGKLKTARKGIAQYSLSARGIAAHAGVDFEQGASAVVELAARVAEVAAWSDAKSGLTINPGLISGGSRANVVAAEARAELDVRSWSAIELTDTERRLRQLQSSNPRVALEVTGGLNRPPMEPSPDSEALAAKAQALAAELGWELGTARSGGGSDGNTTAALGTPTLDGLGLAGEGAHAPHEHIRLESLVPRTALLAMLLGGV